MIPQRRLRWSAEDYGERLARPPSRDVLVTARLGVKVVVDQSK